MEEIRKMLEAFAKRIIERFPEAICVFDFGNRPETTHIIDVYYGKIWILVLYNKRKEGWFGITINALSTRDVDAGFGHIVPDIFCDTEDETFEKLADIFEHPEKY